MKLPNPKRLRRGEKPHNAIDLARAHLADDGALRWTLETRDEYLKKSHDLLVRIVAEASGN